MSPPFIKINFLYWLFTHLPDLLIIILTSQSFSMLFYSYSFYLNQSFWGLSFFFSLTFFIVNCFASVSALAVFFLMSLAPRWFHGLGSFALARFSNHQPPFPLASLFSSLDPEFSFVLLDFVFLAQSFKFHGSEFSSYGVYLQCVFR